MLNVNDTFIFVLFNKYVLVCVVSDKMSSLHSSQRIHLLLNLTWLLADTAAKFITRYFITGSGGGSGSR